MTLPGRVRRSDQSSSAYARSKALGEADVLAVAYGHALNLRPDEPEWEGRDRFLQSVDRYQVLAFGAKIVRRMGADPVERVSVWEPVVGASEVHKLEERVRAEQKTLNNANAVSTMQACGQDMQQRGRALQALGQRLVPAKK